MQQWHKASSFSALLALESGLQRGEMGVEYTYNALLHFTLSLQNEL